MAAFQAKTRRDEMRATYSPILAVLLFAAAFVVVARPAPAAPCDLPGRGTRIEVRLEKYARTMEAVAQLMGRRDALGDKSRTVHDIIMWHLTCATEAERNWRQEISESSGSEADKTLGYDALDLARYESTLLVTFEDGRVKLPKPAKDTCVPAAPDDDYGQNYKRAIESKINSDYWLFREDSDRGASQLNCSRRFYDKAKANAPMFSGADIYASLRLNITE